MTENLRLHENAKSNNDYTHVSFRRCLITQQMLQFEREFLRIELKTVSLPQSFYS